MKSHYLGFLLALLLVLFAGLPASAQNLGGIVKVETRAKTTLYDIRVVGLRAQSQAEALDTHFRTKEGIITVQTDFSRGVCRVEALSTVEPRILEHIVLAAGFQVAKSFHP